MYRLPLFYTGVQVIILSSLANLALTRLRTTLACQNNYLNPCRLYQVSLSLADSQIMQSQEASEILINGKQVTHHQTGDSFEFILNEQLQVLECVKIISLTRGAIRPIYDTAKTLEGMLFELNHVRVNPKLNNTRIIRVLTQALNEIGVQVSNPPSKEAMAICFKPLGEISDNVRFYLNREGNLIFLSPATRLRLVQSNKGVC